MEAPRLDPSRRTYSGATGIYVRAIDPANGRWVNADIAQLDDESATRVMRDLNPPRLVTTLLDIIRENH